jgi:hypothetical protein
MDLGDGVMDLGEMGEGGMDLHMTTLSSLVSDGVTVA